MFRTHGKALPILTATAILVVTPVMRIASWVFLWLMKMSTTRKTSHAKPDVAQPLWIPPKCWRDVRIDIRVENMPRNLTWSAEVHARRSQRGDH